MVTAACPSGVFCRCCWRAWRRQWLRRPWSAVRTSRRGRSSRSSGKPSGDSRRMILPPVSCWTSACRGSFWPLPSGAGMGLAGLASQTLFRNPLASPYVLGVSNGAARGGCGSDAPGRQGPWLRRRACHERVRRTAPSASWSSRWPAAPATSATRCSWRGSPSARSARPLRRRRCYLAGERLQTLVFWLMGGLWQATWRDVLLVTPVTAAALVVSARSRRR